MTDFERILSDLRNRIYRPVYFLMGDEPYFIDEIAAFIEENVLDENEKEFNQSILYGRDMDVPTILEYAKRYPMMSNYQVVIIREAQEIRNIEQLETYCQKPLSSTILVFCYKYKKLDRRKSFARTIEKTGVVFESKRIYDDKLPSWISERLKNMGYGITPKAALLLAEYLGSDLSKIMNELSKLAINLDKGMTVDEKVIEENIGISKDYNIFELQNALGERDVLKANRIVNHFAANEKDHPLVMVVSTLYGFFVKLLKYHATPDKSRNNIASVLGVNPFFVPDYQKAAKNYSYPKLRETISILREYDLKGKGVGSATTGGELMREMIYRILH